MVMLVVIYLHKLENCMSWDIRRLKVNPTPWRRETENDRKLNHVCKHQYLAHTASWCRRAYILPL